MASPCRTRPPSPVALHEGLERDRADQAPSASMTARHGGPLLDHPRQRLPQARVGSDGDACAGATGGSITAATAVKRRRRSARTSPPNRSRTKASPSGAVRSIGRPGGDDAARRAATTICVASSSASTGSWVTSRIVLPVSAWMRRELRAQAPARDRVDGAEGLVHEQDVGIGGEGAGEADALRLPAGQLGRVARRDSRARRGARGRASPRPGRRSAAVPSRAGAARWRCSRATVRCGKRPTDWMT